MLESRVGQPFKDVIKTYHILNVGLKQIFPSLLSIQLQNHRPMDPQKHMYPTANDMDMVKSCQILVSYRKW